MLFKLHGYLTDDMNYAYFMVYFVFHMLLLHRLTNDVLFGITEALLISIFVYMRFIMTIEATLPNHSVQNCARCQKMTPQHYVHCDKCGRCMPVERTHYDFVEACVDPSLFTRYIYLARIMVALNIVCCCVYIMISPFAGIALVAVHIYVLKSTYISVPRNIYVR